MRFNSENNSSFLLFDSRYKANGEIDYSNVDNAERASLNALNSYASVSDRLAMDLIAGKCPQRVYPVGRLDRDTTGVLLLTNDGDMTEKLTHPSYNKKKIYHVFLDKNLSQADFDKILKGVFLDDGMINADALSYIDGDQTQVGIEIHSGRNRIVRRIFEALGYKVEKLDRVYFAGLTKKNLRRGQWRFLTEKELAILKMGSYE